jgi:hypothetical protein
MWTSLKMILTPLNIDRYRLFKVNGVIRYRFTEPNIRCLLTLTDYSISKALTVR